MEGMRANTNMSGLMDLLGLVGEGSPNDPQVSQAVFEISWYIRHSKPLQISHLGQNVHHSPQ